LIFVLFSTASGYGLIPSVALFVCGFDRLAFKMEWMDGWMGQGNLDGWIDGLQLYTLQLGSDRNDYSPTFSLASKQLQMGCNFSYSCMIVPSVCSQLAV
jgi:hypothetical protein